MIIAEILKKCDSQSKSGGRASERKRAETN